MLAILAITSPVFILIALGFVSRRMELVNREQIQGMGSFVISFALPALIIKALAERPIQEIINPVYLGAYAGGSLLAFGLGFAMYRWGRHQDLTNSTLAGLGMSVSNSGFIGYPLVAVILGSPAAIGLALCMMVENLLIIPLALVLAEAGSSRGGTWARVVGETFRRLLRNPVIIGIIIGMSLSILDLRLPPVLFRVVDMLASASAPVALFVIGGSLFGLKVRSALPDAALIGLGKLVVHPLAVLLCFLLLPDIDPILKTVGILFASAPMLSIYPIIGQRFGLEQRCAAVLVLATGLSFMTISSLIAILDTIN